MWWKRFNDAPRPYVWPIVASAVCLGIFALGVADITVWYPHLEPNQCRMTYMRPHYEPVAVPYHIPPSKMTPRPKGYAMLLYREMDPHVMASLNGESSPSSAAVPVLFVPGNAGSYKQVRSIASESARRSSRASARNSGSPRLDFYAAEFGGELGAFRTASLGTQSEFVADCILTIAARYPRGTRVILLGHSIGGVVARDAAAIPGVSGSVKAVVTISTPHTRPIIAHTPKVDGFYRGISGRDTAVPVVSIAGGFRDTLVPSSTCDVGSGHRSLSVLSFAVPGVWVETDHQCAMWCNQLVVAIDKALRAIAGSKSEKPSDTIAAVRPILTSHLSEMFIDGVVRHGAESVQADPAVPATRISGFPAAAVAAKHNGRYTIDMDDLRKSGADSLLVVFPAMADTTVHLCSKDHSCRDVSKSFESVPSQDAQEENQHVLFLGRPALNGVSSVAVQTSSRFTVFSVRQNDAKELPASSNLEKLHHGVTMIGDTNTVMHLQSPFWHGRRPLSMSLTTHSKDDFLVLVFHSPSSLKAARDTRARLMKAGSVVRIASQASHRSLDVFIVPMVQKEGVLSFSVKLRLDVFGLVGELLRDTWHLSVGAAIAALFLARIGACEGTSIIVSLLRQWLAVLLGACTFVLVAPLYSVIRVPVSVEETVLVSVTSVVISLVVEVVGLAITGIGWLSSRIVPSPKGSRVVGIFTWITLSGAVLSVLPSFFGLAAAVFVLARAANRPWKGDAKRPLVLSPSSALRMFIIPTAMAALEVFSSPSLHYGMLTRNGQVDGYEAAAVAALFHAFVGPLPLALSSVLPYRVVSVLITAASGCAVWLGLTRCYVASGIISVASVLI